MTGPQRDAKESARDKDVVDGTSWTAVAVVVAIVGGLVFFLGHRGQVPDHPPFADASATRWATSGPLQVRSRPMRVIISSIGVNAPVVQLGLNADGTLEVPTVFSDAGWWTGGPAPGQKGPAVIVGHIDSFRGPAVFYRLKKLRPGDVVVVKRADGRTARFAVLRSKEVSKSSFPTKEVYGPVAYPGLRLITCGGAFDEATGHYVDNVIVFARLIH